MIQLRVAIHRVLEYEGATFLLTLSMTSNYYVDGNDTSHNQDSYA